MSKDEIVRKLRAEVAAGRPIIGTGAGTGLSGKSAAAGGADLVMIYSSGRFRMGGRSSTAGLVAFGRANTIVMDMAPEILGVVKDKPVVAGVCGWDSYTVMPYFLRQLLEMGVVGVQNAPSIGGQNGIFRQEMEETGLGFDKEIEMIALANSLGMLTVPYVWTAEQALEMMHAGADVIVAHVGITISGSVGATTSMSLEDCLKPIQEISDAARSVRPDVLVLCHGGPIVTPEDAQFIFENTTGIVGYFGASSIERIPVERAISDITRRFKGLSVHA